MLPPANPASPADPKPLDSVASGTSLIAFNDPWHDASFYFRLGGREVHVESERYTRRKHEFINPVLTFCAQFPELARTFRHVVFSVNDATDRYWFRLLTARHAGNVDIDAFLREFPVAPAPLVAAAGVEPAAVANPALAAFVRHLVDPDTHVYFCGHHASHAASAYYSSGLDSALAISMDGAGADFLPQPQGRNIYSSQELVSRRPPRRLVYGSVYDCQRGRMSLLGQVTHFCIGGIWDLVTQYVMGLKEGEEGTVMAMAAAGDASRFRAGIEQSPLMSFDYARLHDDEHMRPVRSFLDDLARRTPSEQDRFDVAAALQQITEARMRAFLAEHVTPSHRHLCVAGGVFLNCQMTGRIREWFPWLESVYIPPAPYDGGLPIGAAQLLRAEVLGENPAPPSGRRAPYGMSQHYDRETVVAAIARSGLPCREASEDEFLDLLAGGRIIALFQGSSESGRRALGNRSIVAHPGIPGLKERINSVIKHRQWYRPFAPMVLAEHIADWFDCAPGFESPYMSFAIPILHTRREAIANVVHLDGTGRVQTVHAELSPALHRQLSAWHRRTGIPVWLNTSFNDREPIVETPADALATFARTAIDHLYFADHGLLCSRPATNEAHQP